MSFVRRTLSAEGERLGDKLRTLRRANMMTLLMMVDRTRVQERYLRALEEGDYASLPAPLYTRQFVRTYVRSLGGDEQYFLELYDREVGQSDLLAPHRLPRERVAHRSFFAIDRWGRLLTTLVLFSLLFFFFAWQLWRVLMPPQVLVSNFVDGVVHEPTYRVQGIVFDGEAQLFLNAEPLSFDAEGKFARDVVLREGPNTFALVARRRFSLPYSLSVVLVYQPVDTFRQE